MPRPVTDLPIESALPALRAALAKPGCAVLRAEPGAGKTTVVPLALLDEPWLAGKSVVMLQPRRLATYAAAERLASQLGEAVGGTVGYRMSLDSRVGPRTRIEVVTEGVLTRRLQADPGLDGVGLVVFDEFHERSLAADLGLALALESRDGLRPDLRLLVMSATLDGPALARLVAPPGADAAPLVDCPGRLHPVAQEWDVPADAAGRPLSVWADPRAFWAGAAAALRRALARHPGDALVFLPGAAEIRNLGAALADVDADILPLHGQLTAREQARVLAPAGRRKLILSTNIAETSLTIDGVRLVVDCGLHRVNRFDPRLGMDRLLTERVSAAAAEQRRGRAGRTAAGTCVRLWPAEERLDPWLAPEVDRADLAGFALEAAVWGAREPAALRLLSPPNPALWRQARALLADLGALDADGGPTAAGSAMAEQPLHPRLAAMRLAAAAEPGRPRAGLAAACAALLAERDVLPPDAGADFRLRLEALDGGPAAALARPEALKRCRALRQRWLDGAPPTGGPAAAGALLAVAFPDRIGRLLSRGKDRQGRPEATYQLSNGRQARLDGAAAAQAPDWLVALDADAGDQAARLYLFAAVDDPDALLRAFKPRLVESLEFEWDGWKFKGAATLRLGKLELGRRPAPPDRIDAAARERACLERLAAEGPACLPWDDAARQNLARLRWASRRRGDLPAWDDDWLRGRAAEWLAPWLRPNGALLDAETLGQAVAALPGHAERQRLDREAPTHLTVPSGSRRPLLYREDDAPILSVRIQELFGLAHQPLVLGVPVLLELLSPANRPLQLTADLDGFWDRTWPEVRKEMRGRYPRHHWPENPREAPPTARAKPRGT